MRWQVSDQEVAHYREKGFVVIDDFLTDEELALWREAVDEAVERRGRTKLAGREDDEGWQDRDTSYYDRVFVQRINLWMDNDKVRTLMLDDRIGKMACDLAGTDGIRIWHDQALNKAPWGNPTGWHLDNPNWSYHSRDALSIWVALDDATLKNGCLHFIPGAHRTARFDTVGIGEGVGDLFRTYTEWADTEPVAATMRAGACSFHNGLTAHGAGANMTPGWRRAMTCAYMPDGSTFNGERNVLPPEYYNSLTVGDVLDDDGQNPLIYHASRPYVEEARRGGLSGPSS